MDEPFSALDAPTREGLQALMLSLCEEVGVTVVLVTHNIEEAAFVGQRVLLLSKPPNRETNVLENTHNAQAEYRNSTAYQNVCSMLRIQIGER